MLFLFDKIKGFNTKNNNKISYLNAKSAVRPVSHSSEIPFPLPPSSLDNILNDSKDRTLLSLQNESSLECFYEVPQSIFQSEPNDLVRDLDHSKDAAEVKSKVNDFTRILMILKNNIKENGMRIC